MYIHSNWQEILIRSTLVLVGLGLWNSALGLIFFPLLVVAWIVDGGLLRFHQTIQEPLVQALLLLCLLLVLGLSWGEQFEDNRMKWLKYFKLLIFVPYYSLLNRERLFWALAGLLFGYAAVLILGTYQSIALGIQGVPLLSMSYLSFSAILGVGFVTLIGISYMNRSLLVQASLWVLALAILLLQFHQNSRVFLCAAVVATVVMFFCYYRTQRLRLVAILLSLLVVVGIFASSSKVFQERWIQIKKDFEWMQQGHYDSSLGYRIAMWDVGLHGIAEKPLLGHGTGVAAGYFEKTIKSYKEGRYQDLPKFQGTAHYHNDWIEIGMHLGLLGISALIFLFWSWYRTFEKNNFTILGVGLISYMLVAGLAETLLVFSKVLLFLLMMTAIIMHWRKQ
ncbi:O-antigen ligase [Nitrosomonas sp. PY1]|uniref:O-antigen ligase family protein n=1 Tax=Nitrosomonas sp. PY1 TaxID=1803906 RepID=UPI001FC81E0F|nr:O-antigen ligase family protein [Nitrosomonas sp. PY1]